MTYKFQTVLEYEIRFLEYRLEVVQSWPDSDRRRATMEAILHRLGRLRGPAGF
jgi:hypothetical protein